MSEGTPRRTISEEQKAKQAEAMRAAWARRSPEARQEWAEKLRANGSKPAALAYHQSEEARQQRARARETRWSGHVKMTREEKLLFKRLRSGGASYEDAKRETLKLREASHGKT